MRLIDDIKQDNQQRATDLTNQDALPVPAAQVCHVLSSAAKSMFGGMKLASDNDTKLVTLTWNDTAAASLELDDPFTFNAMTPSFLENLGRCLTAAFASKEIQALVLQAAGPHFCTGGRYDKKASSLPPWWIKAQGIYGSGYLLDRIRSASIFSISVLQGSSIGGGLLLGLATDHRIATRSATFRLGVAPYGLSPVVMATAVLPGLVGHSLSS